MPKNYLPKEYNFICFHCPLPESQCPDYRNTPKNHVNCPLRKVARNRPTEEQMRRLREIVRLQGYGERHLARMMVLQAERNALPIETVTSEPTKIVGVS